MSKNKKRHNPGGQEFVELTEKLEQPPPQAEEFVSFVDYWAQGAGGAASAASKASDDEFRAGEYERAGEDEAPTAAEPASEEEPLQPEPPPDPAAQARREAEEIIAQAKEEAQRLRQEALEQGLEEGERRGRAEAKKEYGDRISQLKKILAEIQAQRGSLVQNYRQELLDLVRAMVERLVHHEVSTNPEVIKSCLQKARRYVVENSAVRAHVNPEDLAWLREAGLREPALLGGKNRIELVEDPAVGRGGCLLKSPFGEVDATMENGREKLYRAVEQAFAAALDLGADQAEPPPAEEELAVEWAPADVEEDELAVERATEEATEEAAEEVAEEVGAEEAAAAAEDEPAEEPTVPEPEAPETVTAEAGESIDQAPEEPEPPSDAEREAAAVQPSPADDEGADPATAVSSGTR